jgi:hypothetical protein
MPSRTKVKFQILQLQGVNHFCITELRFNGWKEKTNKKKKNKDKNKNKQTVKWGNQANPLVLSNTSVSIPSRENKRRTRELGRTFLPDKCQHAVRNKTGLNGLKAQNAFQGSFPNPWRAERMPFFRNTSSNRLFTQRGR